MQHMLWPSSASSLLEVFQVSHGRAVTDSTMPPSRSMAYSRRWPIAVARLTVFEAAMLQDFGWWGAHMEEQLKRLTVEQSDPRSGS
ncbi:MAG: hypothetical protein KF814_03375 [Nitrospiraceae bacterium]|nr:hypothetical protein [Nitrospiraceae bacterium]